MTDNSVYVFNISPEDLSLAINGVQSPGLMSGVTAAPYTPEPQNQMIVVRCFPGECPPQSVPFLNGQPNAVEVQTISTGENSASVTITLDKTAEDLWLYVARNCLMMFDTKGHLLTGPLCVKWPQEDCPKGLG